MGILYLSSHLISKLMAIKEIVRYISFIFNSLRAAINIYDKYVRMNETRQ